MPQIVVVRYISLGISTTRALMGTIDRDEEKLVCSRSLFSTMSLGSRLQSFDKGSIFDEGTERLLTFKGDSFE